MSKSGAWYWNNCGTRLTSPLITKQEEVKIGWVYLYFSFSKRGSMNQNFLHLFVWQYKENGRRGGSTGGKNTQERNKQHTNTHAHTHEEKKNKGHH